ncbi:class I fructose-bisphosphate aldolase [Microbacterium sp. AK031]|uniref:class I fructose-bisphosphate aldolase n=1 Tax=Microbacterium sp. AK031 TaxID=2723076 RepID=UPI002167D0A8|nr:hypothetical protein [Microbacterium sp. AK031]MCS3845056.1 DhnA family fructose-bisphosphate aldolase class Ia [Microbacterium sp. AK031]
METSEFRLGRLFAKETGRTMIVAFDRGLGASAKGGGESAKSVVKAVVDSGADGILLSPGLLERSRDQLAHRNAPAVLVRTDFVFLGALQPNGTSGEGEEYRRLIDAREAAALGADAIVMFLILGNPDDSVTADNCRAVARAAREAHEVGLPLIVETVLWGSRVKDQTDAEALIYVNRLAAELGADAVKTQYTGDVATMREVVDNTPVPLLLLGGPKTDDMNAMRANTTDALSSGARGLVYGRNVWQADDPAATARTLHDLVHSV